MESRKNMGCCLVNDLVMIYGGVNSLGKYLNDIVSLSLGRNYMQHYEVKFSDKSLESGLAYHQMCAVFPPENKP